MCPAKPFLVILILVVASVCTIQAVPKPQISSIGPNSATAGDPGFKLLVTGDRFNSSSRVRWNGAVRTTRVVTPGQRLEADIPASDVAVAGVSQVSVANQDEGEVSNNV